VQAGIYEPFPTAPETGCTYRLFTQQIHPDHPVKQSKGDAEATGKQYRNHCV